MEDVSNALPNLPHSYPFRFLDKILELEEGRGVGIKNVTINEPFFQGHFKENPIMPGILIIEAMAQIAGIVLHHNKKDKTALIARVKDIKFKNPVLPGDQLKITANIILSLPPLTQFAVKAFVEDDIVAEGEIVLASEG